MSKSLYIAEKPSVAQEFAKALHEDLRRHDGYLESENSVVTWCVGHLVTMSYPEKYDEKYRRWSFDTLPFLPSVFRYEVIGSVEKQFRIVSGLLNRQDVSVIYVCTDSGREGEYIYRLVAMMAKVPADKAQKRVWIDSQTEEEILRGIREAKPITAYDHLSDAAFLRAKEDYLMGINFSRALSLRYAYTISDYLGTKYQAISVGRVMTCVLGMVVRREREIRSFVKTPYYRVLGSLSLEGKTFEGEWRAVEGSQYFQSPRLYKENGFRELADAEKLCAILEQAAAKNGAGKTAARQQADPAAAALQQAGREEAAQPMSLIVEKVERKTTRKNPPLLYNLAEIQNDCSRMFHISPDNTLQIIQELYEKKLVTYPRTDARVLSEAIAKEIDRNIRGLQNYDPCAGYAQEILGQGMYQKIAKTRYTDDKQITDHYAIIPTGQGLRELQKLPALSGRVYDVIVRRFLSIFYPPAVYTKVSLVTYTQTDSPAHPAAAQAPSAAAQAVSPPAQPAQAAGAAAQFYTERLFSNFSVLTDEGYLKVAYRPKTSESGDNATGSRAEAGAPPADSGKKSSADSSQDQQEIAGDAGMLAALSHIRKGSRLPVQGFFIKEGETAPPKRYSSGSMILAMENAGQLIEDEELREQIRGSGIGTSATRAEILKKLFNIHYLDLNKKTQIITPTQMGEMVFDVVSASIRSLLNPELTASWEKGLTYVSEGSIHSEEYMEKLERFVSRHTEHVRNTDYRAALRRCFDQTAGYYQKKQRQLSRASGTASKAGGTVSKAPRTRSKAAGNTSKN